MKSKSKNNKMQLVLPILLDMVEEMTSNLDEQKLKNIEQFAQNFFVIPPQSTPVPSTSTSCNPQACQQQQQQQQQPWMRCGKGRPGFFCAKRQNCSRPRPAKSDGDFTTTFDVQSFKPEEINVKVKGREISIEGKHEEREEDIGFISRQFTRRIVLPEEFEIDSVATVMSVDGKLTIRASKPQPPLAPEPTERIIPIQHIVEKSSEEIETDKKTEA